MITRVNAQIFVTIVLILLRLIVTFVISLPDSKIVTITVYLLAFYSHLKVIIPTIVISKPINFLHSNPTFSIPNRPKSSIR